MRLLWRVSCHPHQICQSRWTDTTILDSIFSIRAEHLQLLWSETENRAPRNQQWQMNRHSAEESTAGGKDMLTSTPILTINFGATEGASLTGSDPEGDSVYWGLLK